MSLVERFCSPQEMRHSRLLDLFWVRLDHKVQCEMIVIWSSRSYRSGNTSRLSCSDLSVLNVIMSYNARLAF